MCGFAGVFSKNKINIQSVKKNIGTMSRQLEHRGPDSKGIYLDNKFCVGFRRLAILDTSSKADQPFSDNSENHTLVFNGEIYNFIELKKKYLKNQEFKSNSDTEVLFHLIIKVGLKILSEIEGMYSFVFYDRKKNKIFFSRDHFGMKPLYYTFKEEKIFFASEIKALLKIKNFKMNQGKLLENIIWGNIAGEETLYKDIYKVRPGSVYEINKNLFIKKNFFFNLKKTFNNQIPKFNLIEKKFKNTIKKHLRSDVKVGILLSGGLDSSIITSFINTLTKKRKINTFSTILKNSKFNEANNQSIIKKLFKTNHQEINFTPHSIIKNLKKCIYFYESPLHHPNIIAIYELCKLAKKKNIKVLFSGDGADELFSGYKWHYEDNISNSILSNSTFTFDTISRIFKIKKNKFKIREMALKESNSKLFKRFYDQSFYLDKWLQRQDKIGMANSVEIRVPFCDMSLIKTVNKFKQIYTKKKKIFQSTF